MYQSVFAFGFTFHPDRIISSNSVLKTLSIKSAGLRNTPENSAKFLKMLLKAFPFEILTIKTDNGTEFTYKFISDEKLCPFEEELKRLGINHKLIKPRTSWHNGKVERSHRMDQRYFLRVQAFSQHGRFQRQIKRVP